MLQVYSNCCIATVWKLAHESKSKNMAEINISPVAVAQFVDGIVHCCRIKYIDFVHLDDMVGVVNFKP